jgi:hypothetical protein
MINIAAGGTCQKVAISTTSAVCTALKGNVAHVTPTVDCFVRKGAPTTSPTALSDGTDHLLLANATQEFRVQPGEVLAFITASGSGYVYIAIVG